MIVPVFESDLIETLNITNHKLHEALRWLKIVKRRYKGNKRYFSQEEAAAITKLIKSGKNLGKELPPDRDANPFHSWHRIWTWR